MKVLSLSSHKFEALQERYTNFMNQSNIQGFIADGGLVTIAAEARSFDEVNAVAQAGHKYFAEKYWQESSEKYVNPLNINLHYFGVLQTNKIHRIMQNFDHLEGIASIRQANFIDRILKESDASVRAKEFFVQINVGREPSKNGVDPDLAPQLIEHCLMLNLPVKGLMTIPPKAEPPAPHFKALRALADSYGLPHCQMGFSRDYPIAIDCGSTHLRIGTLIWGEKYPAHHPKSALLLAEA